MGRASLSDFKSLWFSMKSRNYEEPSAKSTSSFVATFPGGFRVYTRGEADSASPSRCVTSSYLSAASFPVRGARERGSVRPQGGEASRGPARGWQLRIEHANLGFRFAWSPPQRLYARDDCIRRAILAIASSFNQLHAQPPKVSSWNE